MHNPKPCCFSTALILFCVIALSTEAFAQSPVWRVEKDGHQLFVAGTIHLLRKEDYPLPPEFGRAYQLSDMIILEGDPGASATAQIQREMTTASRLPEGQSLQESLAKPTWRKLKQHLQQRGLETDLFQPMRPFMAAISLTLLELRHLGIDQVGVDHHFYRRARADGKRIGFLESPQQQLDFMNAMSREPADEIMLHSLDEIDQLQSQFENMIDSWRNADQQQLERLFVEPMRQQFPQLYNRILVQRNIDWIRQIEQHIETAPTELILVGAAHLIGEDGLLTRLRARGYSLHNLDAEPVN